MLTEQPVVNYSFRDLKWMLRHLALAHTVSRWSKDPSTKVGAVVTTPEYRVVSVGYNGFPTGVDDDEGRYDHRDIKYKLIVHGELNALASAERSVRGCYLFTWPFLCCCRCAGVVVQHGIKAVVAPQLPEHLIPRWSDQLAYSRLIFNEAGVAVVEIPWDELGVDPTTL